MKKWLVLTLIMALSPVLVANVSAQTEDSSCAGESGAAFGLCNAYCDAMECDSADPHASDTACEKVAEKFTQLTGRDLPCVEDTPFCEIDDDCRVFSFLCEGCYCRALHIDEPGLVCDGNVVMCFEDPCTNYTAVCNAGECELSFEGPPDGGGLP